MGQCVKAFLHTQLWPVKTLRQHISDREVYRTLILAFMLMNWCV
jgi:hypothetical protein